MIQKDEDFIESTQYERFVLSRIYPLVPASDNPDELDMRGDGGVHHVIKIAMDIGGGKASGLKQALVPLAFVSAWKVLDLLVELYLYKSGMRPDRTGKWAIAEKTAKTENADMPHLTSELWNGICAIYGATAELRHCMVHRRASYTGRGLEGADKHGRPLIPLTPRELDAFILLVQLLANVVENGADDRTQKQLRYLLSRFGQHIGGDFSGGLPTGPVTLIRADLVKNEHGDLTADFAEMHAKKQLGAPYGPADVLLDIPGEAGYRLFARLEALPNEQATIRLDALPEYLSRY